MPNLPSPPRTVPPRTWRQTYQRLEQPVGGSTPRREPYAPNGQSHSSGQWSLAIDFATPTAKVDLSPVDATNQGRRSLCSPISPLVSTSNHSSITDQEVHKILCYGRRDHALANDSDNTPPRHKGSISRPSRTENRWVAKGFWSASLPLDQEVALSPAPSFVSSVSGTRLSRLSLQSRWQRHI
jgi:hypothetical protein